jgi:transaldolase/glucose-6-phosphate isomerase
MATLARVGVSMTEVTAKLLDEGVRLFADPFAKLLTAIAGKAKTAKPAKINRLT